MSLAFVRLAVFMLALAFPLASARGQGAPGRREPAGPEPEAGRKRALAVQRMGGPIQIDGRLTEGAWATAQFLTDFRQKEPVENGEPSARTEVAFLFDGDALYVGARLASDDPTSIPRALTRRDQTGNAENIVISLDPFLDRRTAYSFGVTSSGVRRDYYHPRDEDDFRARDFTFDPVWEAAAAIDSVGWTAEMRIPFSQLRFNARPVQQWGLQISRWIPNRNEEIFWVLVPRTETGFASRFGLLEGIRGIAPSRRVELLAYVASSGTFRASADPRNPFDPDGRSIEARAGADLKMGLGPSITLDATINPDFGQVEADPAEVNLTAFETFFDERRPFFTERSQLLRGPVENYFYSRRIGGRPPGGADGDYVDRPDATTVLGAVRVTGRLPGGLSLGALAALADREFASTYTTSTASTGRTMIAPRSGFGVVRVQQELGREASTVGAIVSGVTRSIGSAGGDLAGALVRDAVAGGVDWVYRFNGGEYEISGDVGGSYVAGSAAAIQAVQEAPARYLQRPDYDHASVDPTRTSLTGWRGRLRWDKNEGNWLSGAEVSVMSPGFETNAMGRTSTADDIDMNADLNYRWTQPGRLFRNARLGVFARANWNFDGVRTETRLSVHSNQEWHNFFNSSIDVTRTIGSLSDNLTRGGPLMATPSGWEVRANLRSSFAGATTWRAGVNLSEGQFGEWERRISAGLTLRPASAVSLSLDPQYTTSRRAHQYLTTLDGGPMATFGSRYVFGAIRQSRISARIRVNYTFTPNLTLEIYGEPFAASGRYSAIGELTRARSALIRRYGTDGTTATQGENGTLLVTDQRNGQSFSVDVPDFQTLSFRSNAVLRWEWHPGSTLFLVWQQNRSAFCSPTSLSECRGGRRPGDLVGPGALGRTLGAAGDNFVAVKVSYWVPVL